MTETEVPFLFIRINSRAAPFDPLHGVFQHHEFIPQNLFIKKKKSCLKIKFRIILFGKCFIVIFLFWGVVVGISTTKLTETRRWSVVAVSSMKRDRNAEKGSRIPGNSHHHASC
jgi:uncharacterized protein with PQ loop repeat